MTLPVDLKARILEAARAKRAPTRAAGRRRAAAIISIAACVALSIFFVVGGFAHGVGRPLWFEVTTVAAWTLMALWATWGAFGRHGMLGRTRTFLLAVAIGTPLALLAFMLQFDWTCPAVTEPFPGKIGFKCLGLGLATGAALLSALTYARRASDPVHPLATGAALGAATGAWAGVFTDLWCPASNPSHILLGHILPILLLTLMGLAGGKLAIAMKARARQPT